MIWHLLQFLVAFALLTAMVVGVPLAAAVWISRLAPGEWPQEETCSNPQCRHDVFEHQTETEDGACSILNCGCRRFEREDRSWSR